MNILNDKSGSTCVVRLSVLIWTVAILVGWGYVSFLKGELQSVPESVVAILGILLTGKVAQSFSENRITASSLQN